MELFARFAARSASELGQAIGTNQTDTHND
jgi:hypothetical protein